MLPAEGRFSSHRVWYASIYGFDLQRDMRSTRLTCTFTEAHLSQAYEILSSIQRISNTPHSLPNRHLRCLLFAVLFLVLQISPHFSVSRVVAWRGALESPRASHTVTKKFSSTRKRLDQILTNTRLVYITARFETGFFLTWGLELRRYQRRRNCLRSRRCKQDSRRVRMIRRTSTRPESA